jgi:hypothetical protein
MQSLTRALPEHQLVRVNFTGSVLARNNPTCKAIGFDVFLTVDGQIGFTANGFMLPDAISFCAPRARKYLIGWVVDPVWSADQIRWSDRRRSHSIQQCRSRGLSWHYDPGRGHNAARKHDCTR